IETASEVPDINAQHLSQEEEQSQILESLNSKNVLLEKRQRRHERKRTMKLGLNGTTTLDAAGASTYLGASADASTLVRKIKGRMGRFGRYLALSVRYADRCI
ncbi:unnamed protein product, partial [Didymodactylos carnosus]